MIQLILVYPNQMTCDLLSAALQPEPDINIVGCAHTDEEALTLLSKESECNMVLVSIELPDNGAFKVARAVRQSEQDVKTLITELVQSKTAILRCIEEGIAGYVLVDDSLADLVKKLRAVHEEEFLVSPTMASALIERVGELKQMLKEFHTTNLNWTEELFAELTPREWDVLHLIEEGCDNQTIADQLVIEKGTVKNHVHNILSKLDVRSRNQAAMLARQLFADEKAEKAMSRQSIPRFPLVDGIASTFQNRQKKTLHS